MKSGVKRFLLLLSLALCLVFQGIAAAETIPKRLFEAILQRIRRLAEWV